jgi:hypothetical protein
MARKRRRWEEIVEEDPAAGLLNLFDVWIAFAAALLLAIAGYLNLPKPPAAQASNTQPGTVQMENLKPDAVKMQRYRPTNQQLSGEGQRLGTAYRLKSGEVVYVPETP